MPAQGYTEDADGSEFKEFEGYCLFFWVTLESSGYVKNNIIIKKKNKKNIVFGK